MAAHHHHLLSIFIALTIISIVSATGITIELIDRDSPDSPFYSNSTSDVEKLYDSFRRSNLRARELARAAAGLSPSIYSPPVYTGSGSYLVELGLGAPETRFVAIMDTGSDLTWTQCAPCKKCFDQVIPIFDPIHSTSYSRLTCDSEECNRLPPKNRGCATNACTYAQGYGDGSTSAGDLAHETLTFGYGPGLPRSRIANLTIVCGHRNEGPFSIPETGLFGLGQGPLSFPWQTYGNFRGRFAYCLIPKSEGFNVKSKLTIGTDAYVYGRNIAMTPMASGPVSSHYYLSLKGVSVIPYSTTRASTSRTSQTPQFTSAKLNGSGLGSGPFEVGNMLIDSGTSLTYLPVDMFDHLLWDLKLTIVAQAITDPSGNLYLCYQGDIDAPYITFHFAGGADLRLPKQNTFVTVAKDVICLAMLPAELGEDKRTGVFGNMAQANFIVSYNLNKKTVTFKGTDCKTYKAT